MKYRTFGNSGLRVSELILGAMTFGEQGGVGSPPAECRAVLDAFAEAGGNTIDTAVNYRGGLSEEILGDLLKGRRDAFVLGSKYSLTRDSADPNAGGNARKNLRASLETSLRRLGTDYLDIYWVHIWDRATPIEETMRALDDAVRAGKVLYVGISDAPAWVVARANTLADWKGWSPFAGLQVPYSLIQRDVERELLPMAQALGLAVTAWSPLGGGVLSGKYASGAPDGPARLRHDRIDDRSHRIAREVTALAAEIGVTPAQVALAWTRSRHASVIPIVGARNAAQLADNLGALDVTLTPEQCDRLESVTEFEPGFPSGFIAESEPWVFGAGAVLPVR